MSETNPVYSKNPVFSGLEHVGHWLHVSETGALTVVGKLPEVVKVMDDVRQDSSQVIPAITAIVIDGTELVSMGGEDVANFLALTKAIWATFPAAFVGGNLNPLLLGEAILAAVQDLPTLEKDAVTFANLPALFSKLLGDITSLKAEVVTDWQKLQKDATTL